MIMHHKVLMKQHTQGQEIAATQSLAELHLRPDEFLVRASLFKSQKGKAVLKLDMH